MLNGLFIASLIGTAIKGVKEAFTQTIPAENWANKDLYYQDMMNGVPINQRIKNAQNGKYKLVNKHPEPHRDPITGKIVIENSVLFNEDVKKYGAYQAYKWVEQGKYNLTPEELKKEEERIKQHFEYMCNLMSGKR